MKTYRFAIVGCGRIAIRHLEAITGHPQAQLVAVYDVVTERAQRLVGEREGVRIAESIDDLVNDSSIDVVHVCTPSGTHADVAVAVLEAGRHVVIEKPLALRPDDARRVQDAQRKSGKTAVVVMQNRYNPAIVFLQEHRTQLGTLRAASAKVFWYRPQEYYDDGMHGTRALDGGVLANQAVHYIDMLTYLVADTVDTVSAFGATVGHRMECEDLAAVLLHFRGGVIATLEANTITYPENLEGSVTLFFEHATVKVGGTALNRIELWRGEGADAAHDVAEHVRDVYGSGHHKVVAHMIDCLEQGLPPSPSIDEQVHVVDVLDAAYRSMKEHCIITL